MSSTLPIVGRRRVLLGAAALALLGGSVTTACGSTPPLHEMDALLGQLERAHDDSTLAGNAATAAPPKLAAVLTVVAAQRAAHAQALTDEITRISGEAPQTSATGSTASSPTTVPGSSSPTTVPGSSSPTTVPGSSSPTTVPGPPPKPPSTADVVAALQRSADAASLLATQQSGYRAGLLGSIAAACTASALVALAGQGQTP
ncbi:hypothetical protein [Mycolicibacterium sp.]|uniref:hypothetical protein n=1 Tax=Mycolicibacterium sp. TaxID=2320850 RepID=UPI001A2C609D|nr:hypothetical protein [Mycolicibacterium sp.]MBJ7341219.1 hypothetical protein [Mycolicibacterium sp.]